MRPPDFFASSRRFHRPSSILFPPVCCFPRRTPARPSDSASFPPAAGPDPRNLPLRPSPAEKFPQRTAAPRTAGTKKPFCGRFGPPTRSPLEWNSI